MLLPLSCTVQCRYVSMEKVWSRLNTEACQDFHLDVINYSLDLQFNFKGSMKTYVLVNALCGSKAIITILQYNPTNHVHYCCQLIHTKFFLLS